MSIGHSNQNLLNYKYHCTADFLFYLLSFRSFAYAKLLQIYFLDPIQSTQTGGQPFTDNTPPVTEYYLFLNGPIPASFSFIFVLFNTIQLEHNLALVTFSSTNREFTKIW